MKLSLMSNTMLGLGVVMLAAFGVLQGAGLNADPMIPAFAALFIGCTAVLDRVGAEELP